MSRESHLDLNDILQHPGRTLETKFETELPNQEDVNLVRPVQGNIKAYSTGNALIFSGEFNVICIVDCSRCSHPLEQIFKFDIQEEFDTEGVPSGYGTGGMARVIIPPEEEEEPIFQENNLLVAPLLRQIIVASMPMQNLCSYGWEGNCPHAYKAKEDLDARKNHFIALESIIGKGKSMIVLDAMGGDFAPKEAVKGALEALPLLHYPLTLVGDTSLIQTHLPENFSSNQFHLCHSTEVITMEDKPVSAIRQKRQSSIVVGIDLITSGQAKIFVSAGNTGAVAAASLLSWRQMSGVHRPALTTIMPNLYDGFVLLDVGASPDIQPQHLIDFAIMGRSYAEIVLKRVNPRVQLLNIGEEEGKGNAFAKQAYQLLSKYSWFTGNIESKDAFHQRTDVVLCDAFVGNIFLKTCEGIAEMMFKMMKDQVPKNPLIKPFYFPLKKMLKPLIKKGDYAEQGGSPLLGLNNISIICHGRSNSKAIKNALLLAQKTIDGQLLENIRRNIKKGAS